MRNLKATVSVLLMILLFSNCASAQNKKGKGQTETSVLECIMTRTSVRSYLDKSVEEEKIEKLLRAGMAAPSAMNKQPWHFVVITEKSILESLSQASPNARAVANAPLAIVVCGDMTKALEGGGHDFWIQDTSAASENILLAAHALGLGAVWTGTYPSQERCEAVSRVLSLPDYLIPLNTIVIGYPNGTTLPKDKWNPDNISYNKYNEK
ncbi:MAG: nitroreductase family protein [Prevotella sp.]|nr:nitroreductase family protein [Prevotella sp.]